MTISLTPVVDLACIFHPIIPNRLILDKYLLEIYLVVLLERDACLLVLNSLDALCKLIIFFRLFEIPNQDFLDG